MLPKVRLTLHSRTSGSRWVITPLWLSGSLIYFLYSYSVYSCHLFLIPSSSVRWIPLLSFIVPIVAWNVSLVSLIFWRDLWSFLFYRFPLFLCIDHLGRLSYLSFLFFGALDSDGYIFPFSFAFHFSSFLSYICKASSDNQFAFLHFFFLGMVLITTSCTMLQTSVHSSSGILFIRSNPLNLFVDSTV